MTDNEIEVTIKEYILQTFLQDDDAANLSNKTILVSAGILDSLSALELVAFLEETYCIQVKAHEVNVDNLDTISKIANFVRSKRL